MPLGASLRTPHGTVGGAEKAWPTADGAMWRPCVRHLQRSTPVPSTRSAEPGPGSRLPSPGRAGVAVAASGFGKGGALSRARGAGGDDFRRFWRAEEHDQRTEAWVAWKRAFKEAESRNDVSALRRALTLIDELPAFGQLNTLPWWIGSPPALPTARYLKRRANRYLRRQAADAPERYLALALPLLTASRSLNPGTQWLTTDILYGRNRVVLASHGRILRLLPPADPDPWARSDQAGDVWNAALTTVRRLFADPTRAWQVREFAARVIVANGQHLTRVPASRLPPKS